MADSTPPVPDSGGEGAAIKAGANWYGTRQHYGTEWTRQPSTRGMRAKALCSTESNPVGIYDQAACDSWRTQYPDSKPVTVTALPLCKRCERKEAKSHG